MMFSAKSVWCNASASPKQAKDLVEEGVAIAPLPDLLTPRPKKKLN